MRELKFRAWDTHMNRFTDPAHIYIEATGDLRGWGGRLDAPRFVIEQYTGRKDKNGVEIYEGDIVTNGSDRYKVDFDDWDNCQAYEDNESGYGWYLESIEQPGHDDTSLRGVDSWSEVIGNIHANPELLEVKS